MHLTMDRWQPGTLPSCWFDEVRRVKLSVEVKLVSVTTACVSNRSTGRRPSELCRTSVTQWSDELSVHQFAWSRRKQRAIFLVFNQMQQSELLLKSSIVLVVEHMIGKSCDQWRNVGSTLRWQLVIEPLGQRSATGRHSVCVWVPCFPPVWMSERNFQLVPIRRDSLLICGFAVRSCNPNFFCLALWNDWCWSSISMHRSITQLNHEPSTIEVGVWPRQFDLPIWLLTARG